MALPIVGKFYNKLYHDPAFRDYKNHPFPEIDQTTLAMLDIPHFKETNSEKKISNFWGIFGGDTKKRDERKSDRQEKIKESEIQTNTKKEATKEDEPKTNIWKKIKDALKKKE